MYSEVGKQMVNAEFSRICRFVKLLVNENFLVVISIVLCILVLRIILRVIRAHAKKWRRSSPER